MGGIGALNPLPFQIGGGQSETETIYRELRKAVGEGGAGPARDANPTHHDSIEDLWRLCKSQVVAAAVRTLERGTIQAFPFVAEDFLDEYEEALGLGGGGTLVERQREVAAAWVLQLSAIVPDMRTELQRIDPQADIDQLVYEQVTYTQLGKMFGPMPGASAPPYGSGVSASVDAALFPNYSSDFILFVRYSLLTGQTQVPAVSRALIARYLNEVLPSWVDWVIFTGTPFLLDGGPAGDSLLDQTAFG